MAKRMKKINFLILGILLVLTPFALAQEIADQQDIVDAGITPDSPLYVLDIAIEKIIELFSENSKLLHAKERLAEVKVMIQQNKLQAAERARDEFEKIRLTIKNQTRIEEHKKLMDNLGSKISIIASQQGSLTESQISQIKTLIFQHKDRIKKETENIANRGIGI